MAMALNLSHYPISFGMNSNRQFFRDAFLSGPVKPKDVVTTGVVPPSGNSLALMMKFAMRIQHGPFFTRTCLDAPMSILGKASTARWREASRELSNVWALASSIPVMMEVTRASASAAFECGREWRILTRVSLNSVISHVSLLASA